MEDIPRWESGAKIVEGKFNGHVFSEKSDAHRGLCVQTFCAEFLQDVCMGI